MTDHPPHFSQEEMQRTVDRLRAEGRLPSLEDFLKVVGKVRDRNHGLFLVPPRPPDATIEYHGAICFVTTHNPDAAVWIAEHVQGCYAYWIKDTLLIDRRNIASLVDSMRDEGFNVTLQGGKQ